MKKYLFMLFVITFIVIPNKVLAEEEFVEVSKEVKYFKTVYYDDNSSSTYSTNSSSETKSYTIEVTEDEYYNHDTGISPHGTTVTTEYKKMVASILSSGSKYRYHVLLDWQQIPKTRSYDIIGIGHPTDVKLSGNLNFSQEYCISGGGCSCTTSYTSTQTSTGATATFKLPTGTLTALIQSFYFDVDKNASTVTDQYAYGDYSHATKTITKANALKHSIGQTGIKLNSSISSYYDSISYALARWTGKW